MKGWKVGHVNNQGLIYTNANRKLHKYLSEKRQRYTHSGVLRKAVLHFRPILSPISVKILLNIYVYVKTKIVVIIALYILSLLSRFSICDVISPLKVFISKYHLFSTE